MAALKHHGYEVARIVYTETVADTEYRVTLSGRSDGHILRRLVALNIHPPMPCSVCSGTGVVWGARADTRPCLRCNGTGAIPFERPADAHHDYGWKLWRRTKARDAESVRRSMGVIASALTTIISSSL